MKKKSLPILLIISSLLILPSAIGMPITYGVTVTATKTQRNATFTVTNTGNYATDFLITRKTTVVCPGSKKPGPATTPRVTMSYRLNGTSQQLSRSVVTLDAGASAKLTMAIHVSGGRPLTYNRTITTTVTADQKNYIAARAVYLPTPVSASAKVVFKMKGGSN